jgi:hypothetical protein
MLSSPSMFNDPSATSAALPTDEYIQPNLGHALRVWWAFYWRTSLISGVFAFGAAYGLRMLYENTAVRALWIGWAMKLAPYALFYGVAIFVIRSILHKKFRHFRIGLSPSATPGSRSVLEPTLNSALRVWWVYSWRAVLFSFVAVVLVSYPMGIILGLFAPGPMVMGLFSTALGFFVSAGVGLYVIYSNILDEDIANFHVCLLPRGAVAAASAEVVPDTAMQ